jgi:hypothetical protein
MVMIKSVSLRVISIRFDIADDKVDLGPLILEGLSEQDVRISWMI